MRKMSSWKMMDRKNSLCSAGISESFSGYHADAEELIGSIPTDESKWRTGKMDRIGRFTGFFRLLAIVLFAAVFAGSVGITSFISFAEGNTASSTNDKTGYQCVIDDEAGLLSDTDAVLAAMEPVTEYGNAAFYSVDWNGYSSAKECAQEKYYELFGNDSGILFLIDMDYREIYIACDGAVYKTVTRAKAYTITDNVYTYASAGDYDSCAIKAFTEVSTMLGGGHVAEPMRIVCALLMAFCLALLVTFMLAKSASVRGTYSKKEAFEHITATQRLGKVSKKLIRTQRVRIHSNNGGGGGGHRGGGGFSGGGFSGGGGGFSGGGGHGGGFSGGGGGHGF